MVLMVLSHTQLMVSIHLLTFLKVASSLCNSSGEGDGATSQREQTPPEQSNVLLETDPLGNRHLEDRATVPEGTGPLMR